MLSNFGNAVVKLQKVTKILLMLMLMLVLMLMLMLVLMSRSMMMLTCFQTSSTHSGLMIGTSCEMATRHLGLPTYCEMAAMVRRPTS